MCVGRGAPFLSFMYGLSLALKVTSISQMHAFRGVPHLLKKLWAAIMMLFHCTKKTLMR